MKVLVLNSGSSSIKYQLINTDDEKVMAKGNFEKIGSEDSFLTHKVKDEKYKTEEYVKNHREALKIVFDQFTNKEYGVIEELSEIDAIGHRIVHGGTMTESAIVTDEVVEKLKECEALDPLHNPPAIAGIEACQSLMPNTPMTVIFDTAFHSTIPAYRYLYPIPYEYYEKYGIRKYGFHGTSHKYIGQRTAELLGKKENDLKIISCHIGQGASLCAIENGKSVDTTMGFTSLGGIMMGSRSGDLDPSIVTFLMRKENINSSEMDRILNKESGLKGISGVSEDNRDLLTAIQANNEYARRCEIALEEYCYIIAQYIAKMAVAMNGVDVISFAGGVGERGNDERKRILEHLEWMGVEIDREANKEAFAKEAKISTDNSKVQVWVVPTEEELMIARETRDLVENK